MQDLIGRQRQVNTWAASLLEQEPLLAEKMVRHCDVTREEVPEALEQVLRFLWLCREYPTTLTPSETVDRIWHEFILFTRTYEQFCQTHLGRFIHHQPSAKPTAEAQQYRATLSHYQACFGEPLPRFWPRPDVRPQPCGACEAV